MGVLRLNLFIYFVLLWRLVEFLITISSGADFLPHPYINHLEMLEQPLGISSIIRHPASHSSRHILGLPSNTIVVILRH